MALTTDERQKVGNGLQRHWSGLFEEVAISKADVLAAVAATDGWIESNQTAYNTALPDAAKNNLTQSQKTLLFCAVALARVSLAFLRKVFGEVE